MNESYGLVMFLDIFVVLMGEYLLSSSIHRYVLLVVARLLLL